MSASLQACRKVVIGQLVRRVMGSEGNCENPKQRANENKRTDAPPQWREEGRFVIQTQYLQLLLENNVIRN